MVKKNRLFERGNFLNILQNFLKLTSVLKERNFRLDKIENEAHFNAHRVAAARNINRTESEEREVSDKPLTAVVAHKTDSVALFDSEFFERGGKLNDMLIDLRITVAHEHSALVLDRLQRGVRAFCNFILKKKRKI